MTMKSVSLLACLLHLTTLSVAAFDFVPFRARNLAPPALVRTLATAEPARLVAPGAYRAYVDLDLASNATLSGKNGEQIQLDGETLVATLGVRRGLGKRLQIGFELPWIRHDSGSLDGFIDNWHDFFGLPNGDRDQLADDQLTYRYLRNGEELLNLDRSASSLGDLRLQLGWQLADSELTAAALHLSLKLPTGAADKLTGSEAWGASLALALERSWLLDAGASTAVWGGLGTGWLGDGKLLATQARNWTASAWFGAGWSPLQWLAFKLQLDSRTPLYDSELTELGSPSLLLTMGGTLGLGEQTSLDLAVGEDLGVKTAPDVTFQLALSRSF